MAQPAVARIWQGRTRESSADKYAQYLYEEGVKKIRTTKGNLGVQVFRRVRDGVAEFMTISYWTHHLPKDHEYLLELPPHVQHFDILVNEWDRAGS